MLPSIRAATRLRYAAPTLGHTFATSAPRSSDLSRLTLIGTLIREPETRLTKNDKEYVVYVLPFHAVCYMLILVPDTLLQPKTIPHLPPTLMEVCTCFFCSELASCLTLDRTKTGHFYLPQVVVLWRTLQ